MTTGRSPLRTTLAAPSPETGEAVGLHFAGETDPDPAQEHAIVCHLPDVLQRLGVRLATKADVPEAVVAGLKHSEQTPRGKPSSSFSAESASGNRGRRSWLPSEGGSSWASGEQKDSGGTEGVTFNPDHYTEVIFGLRLNGVTPWEVEALGYRLGVSERSDLVPPREITQAAPELGPAGWAAIGFASGAVARLLGRETAPEFAVAGLIGAKATAFIVGAIVGSRAVDGKL